MTKIKMLLSKEVYMDKITQLALECGVCRATVMKVAERIHEKEGGDTYRYPTKEEIINRHKFYKPSGRPKKYNFEESKDE